MKPDGTSFTIEFLLELRDRFQTFLPVSGGYVDRCTLLGEISGGLEADAIVSAGQMRISVSPKKVSL